jgi:hypothetical protein
LGGCDDFILLTVEERVEVTVSALGPVTSIGRRAKDSIRLLAENEAFVVGSIDRSQVLIIIIVAGCHFKFIGFQPRV